ncbi:MAG: methyltransferase [Flavobacteriales bacterium]
MQEQATQDKTLTPDPIMETGLGFMASKTLLTAIKLDLFTAMEEGSLSEEGVRERLGLNGRALRDFLDSLVALGFLERTGIGEGMEYANTEASSKFLVKGKPEYMGGIFEMANDRLYKYWDGLETALRTGEPQNEIKESGKPVFDAIYEDAEKLRQFVDAMAGVQMGNFTALAQKMDFGPYDNLVDLGGAGGELCWAVHQQHPHLECTVFELPKVTEIAEANIEKWGIGHRVKAKQGDLFEDKFPAADLFTMGNILHDWGEADKKMLLKKAYEALNEGGALIVIENIIDNERRENVPGLMMSLNMLIETEEGANFTGTDFEEWAKETGFRKVELMPLAGPSSAAIAYK